VILMEIEIFILAIVGTCLFLPVGWLVGRLLDLNWRCKKMRQFLKKDYRLLKIKFKGSKTIFNRIVDVSSGVIIVGSQHWVLSSERMYQENNEKVGLNIKKIDKDPSYDDGCPVIFVDGDNISPLEFQGDNTCVRPEELGSTYSGYILNQMMKALSFVKNIKTHLMLAVFLSLLAVIFGYMAFSNTGDIKTMQAQQQAQLNNISATINPMGIGTQQVISANPVIIK
jgi:hypothetical protein